MNTPLAKRIVLASRPNGAAQLINFRLEPYVPPPIVDGEILVQVLYMSLDPYMRGRMDAKKSYADPVAVAGTMPSIGIGRVLDSRDPMFKAGALVVGQTGWQTHAILRGGSAEAILSHAAPITTRLGVLGMPGFTAYAGMAAIGKPTQGETVVVAAATGPVGSLVGQLAMLNGARAIGIAGGSEKCDYLVKELGFDAAVDHRAESFPQDLAIACPHGIDVYFENVGGHVWEVILPLLNSFARVPLCGLIANYDGDSSKDCINSTSTLMRQILTQRLHLQGFIYSDYLEEYHAAFLDDVGKALHDGHIRYREDIVDGLENAPKAFLGMLRGSNFGKLIIRVSE